MSDFKHRGSALSNQKGAIDQKVAVRLQPPPHKGSELIVPINVQREIVGNSIGGGLYSVSDNRVSITGGVLHAREPQTINFQWSLTKMSLPGTEFVDYHYKRFFSHAGFLRDSKKRYTLIDAILANLLGISLGGQLLYSRRHGDGNLDWRNTIKFVDYLESEGLIINVLGKNNEFQRNSSWMIPTEKLRVQFEEAKMRVALKKDSSLVELRDKDKNAKSLCRVGARKKLKLKVISNTVQDYNMLWLKHEATVGSKPVVPFCKRIFNESDGLDLGGRWYGAYQNMPKDLRSKILIDGQSTVEPDFKAIHYCLLYSKVGIQLDPSKDDPYAIDGFDRKTIKIASLVLLNSDDLSRFKANITKSGNPEKKKKYFDYKNQYERFLIARSEGFNWDEPKKHKSLKGFIEGMPDHIEGSELLDAIMLKHSKIAHFFGTPNIGLRLQNVDSEIMARAIKELTALDIPALPIHDSLRCRVSDVDLTVDAMRRAYRAITGFDCVIDC